MNMKRDITSIYVGPGGIPNFGRNHELWSFDFKFRTQVKLAGEIDSGGLRQAG